MDRLLRASAPDMLTGEPNGCVDAEQLAAWADGGLDAAAARIVETHLASCASCQAMAAAFARVVPPAAVPARHTWTWRWIVPIAATAAAAALAIWVLVPRSPVVPAAERTMAENEIAPAPAPRAPASAASATTAPVAPAPPADAMRKASAPAATARRDVATASTGAPVGSLRQDVDRPMRQAAAEIRSEPPPVPAAAPAAIEAPSAPAAAATRPQETTTVTAAAPLIQAQSGERSFTVSTEQAANLSVETARARGAFSPPPAGGVAAEFTVPKIMMDGVSAIDVGGAMVDTRATATATASRWRVLANGTVQRSATNDGPWEAVTIDPAVHITTGVAPLPAVCWLVGRDGVVLRTSDAQHFERVPFPATVDLVLIRAQDGSSATITAADGRMWTTTDEGKTWK
jgi:hypothetical protein